MMKIFKVLTGIMGGEAGHTDRIADERTKLRTRIDQFVVHQVW